MKKIIGIIAQIMLISGVLSGVMFLFHKEEELLVFSFVYGLCGLTFLLIKEIME